MRANWNKFACCVRVYLCVHANVRNGMNNYTFVHVHVCLCASDTQALAAGEPLSHARCDL